MGYRKFRAKRIFDGFKWAAPGSVLVCDDQGTIAGLLPETEAGTEVEEVPGILCPGMINAHCHLELSHLKGRIPRQTGMLGFIKAVMSLRKSSVDEINRATEEAETQMLLEGIVATGDICNTTDSLPQKNKGRMYYHNFIEVAGFIPSMAEQRFQGALQLFQEFGNYYGIPIESNSLVPHAPYSVSPELFEKITNFPGNHLLCMHSQESKAEEDFFREKSGDFLDLYKTLGQDISHFRASGKSSLQNVLPYFRKNQSLILVHNVTTSYEDIDLLKQTGSLHNTDLISFCICPNANLYIGNGLPDISLLSESGLPVVLGTDSLASNDTLSIVAEIKTIHRHFPTIDMAILLKWATSNGARALQMEEILGSFEKGKQPGVLSLEGETVEEWVVRRVM